MNTVKFTAKRRGVKAIGFEDGRYAEGKIPYLYRRLFLACRLLTRSWVCDTRVEMPIPLFADVVFKGVDAVPFGLPILKALPWVVLTWVLKWYFGGASNTSERLMHSKVVMITVS